MREELNGFSAATLAECGLAKGLSVSARLIRLIRVPFFKPEHQFQ
ncbi:MAG: hypothetical protein SNJ55_10880 [Chloroherpetonaceae bacterium]